jgi:hypothetical protein
MSKVQDSIRIDAESDEYEVTSVVPVPPSWRDVWAILRGRYEAKVKKVKRLTSKGMHRELKRVWTADTLYEDLYRGDELLSRLKPGIHAIYRERKPE